MLTVPTSSELPTINPIRMERQPSVEVAMFQRQLEELVAGVLNNLQQQLSDYRNTYSQFPEIEAVINAVAQANNLELPLSVDQLNDMPQGFTQDLLRRADKAYQSES